MIINNKRIKLQIWDTAGQERFRTITSTYYRGTHGVIIVYDVTNGESFANVKRWLQEIQQNCEVVNKVLGGFFFKFQQTSHYNNKYISVGNKDDDPSRKVVITDDAKRFAQQMDIELFETSAKDNINVEEMFLAITKQVLTYKLQNAETVAQSDDRRIKLGGGSKNNKKKKKCC